MTEWRIVRIDWKAYDDEGTIISYMFEFRVPKAVTMEEMQVLKAINEPDAMKSAIKTRFNGECQQELVAGEYRPVMGYKSSWFDLEDVTELYGDKWIL